MSSSKNKNNTPSAAAKKNRPRNLQQVVEESMTPLDRVMDKLTNSIETGHRHPYLIDHEVANFDLTLDKDGNLLGIGVNLKQSFVGCSYRPKAQTMITISPEGRTSMEPGTRIFGSALMIGHQEFRNLAQTRLDPNELTLVFVTEDYPTGAFLHMKTGRPVAVAFKNANIKNVVSFFRKQFPQTKVIVCLNNDDLKRISRDKAVEAVTALGVPVTYPIFNKHEKFRALTSFNDLCMVHGHEVALERLYQGILGGKK